MSGLGPSFYQQGTDFQIKLLKMQMQAAGDDFKRKADEQIVKDRADAQAAYEKARAQQILDINGAKGRSETILSDVFNNAPSGIVDGVLK